MSLAETCLIPMTHLPEIGNKTGTRKLVPVSDASDMQFGTKFFLSVSGDKKDVFYFCGGLWC